MFSLQIYWLSFGTSFFLLLPEMLKISFQFDKKQLKVMLNYGFAILIVGLAGMVSQGIDKILYSDFNSGKPKSHAAAGYLGGQGLKLAILMNVFIQAFRYAFEPFFFSHGSKNNDPKSLCGNHEILCDFRFGHLPGNGSLSRFAKNNYRKRISGRIKSSSANCYGQSLFWHLFSPFRCGIN